jgi:hypothetical protein
MGVATKDVETCCPFHPAVPSASERKWQILPNFQHLGSLRFPRRWLLPSFFESSGVSSRSARW